MTCHTTWQSVESAPKDGTVIMGIVVEGGKAYHPVSVWWCPRCERWEHEQDCTGIYLLPITHWSSLVLLPLGIDYREPKVHTDN